ncbi:MAG: MATE family efflux transporter [Acholeplasmatales bacterium]|jgi:Na+-driven multidrug efflux pump|nr:MATE family efflux transporter [Acholeplasmatales bacterium]
MKDLTKGKPLPQILWFMVPILLSSIFQQFYSVTDTIIVSHTIGDNAMAGVSSVSWITALILNFAIGLVSGFSIFTARAFGKKDYDTVKKSFSQGIIIAVIIGAILTAVSLVYEDFFLDLIKTLPELRSYAHDYIFIGFICLIVTILYNLCVGMLRSVGDSKFPLFVLIGAVIVNVGLDFLFITGFKWGVTGAAVATSISNFLALIVTFIYMRKKYDFFKINFKDLIPNFKVIGSQINIGIPMAINWVLISIGSLFVQTATNTLGQFYAISFSAGGKIEGFAGMALSCLGTAFAFYVSQCYGAKQYDKIKKATFQSFILAICYSVFAGCLIAILAKPLASIFLSDVDTYFDTAKIYIYCDCAFYCSLACIYIFRSALQSIKKQYHVYIAGFLECVIRILFYYLSVNYLGFVGVALSVGVTWSVVGIYVLIVCLVCLKKLGKKESINTDLQKI